jgi:hypothetical protein
MRGAAALTTFPKVKLPQRSICRKRAKKLGVIEGVESFQAKQDGHGFGESHSLAESHVEVCRALVHRKNAAGCSQEYLTAAH